MTQPSRRMFLESIVCLSACGTTRQHSEQPRIAGNAMVNTTASASARWTGAASQSPWKIGVCMSFSGENAELGSAAREGVELAISLATRSLTRTDRPYTLVFVDDASTMQKLDAGITTLMEQEQVHAVIGPLTSAGVVRVTRLANQYRIPLIAPLATNPLAIRNTEFVFRPCFSDEEEAKVMARYLFKNQGKNRFGLLYTARDSYSSTLVDAFRSELYSLKTDYRLCAAIEPTETDFSKVITDIRGMKLDAVYAPLYPHLFLPLVNQAKNAGVEGPIWSGGDAWDSSELLRHAGTALEGALHTTHWVCDDPNSANVVFVKAFRDKFRRDPTSVSALGYDTVGLLLRALRGVESDPQKTVRDALANTLNFQGVTGNILSLRNGNARKFIPIARITNSMASFAASVEPS